MRRLGIVVAMDEEADPIIQKYNLSKDEIRGFTVYSGPHFTVILSGVGVMNATLATYILIHELKCGKVINFGVAGFTGTLYEHHTVFSVGKVYKRDVDFTALGYEPYHFPDKPGFIQLETDKRLPVLDCYTSDEFIGPKSAVPDHVLVDMEGYCVADVCQRYGVPCMVYKSISDQTTDDDTREQFDTHLSDAVNTVSDFVDMNILQSFLS
jgi:nucleoside phosphorylase